MNEIFLSLMLQYFCLITQKQGKNGSIMYLLLFFFCVIVHSELFEYLLEVQFVFRQKTQKKTCIPKGKLEYFTWLIADKINNIFHQRRRVVLVGIGLSVEGGFSEKSGDYNIKHRQKSVLSGTNLSKRYR